MSDTNGQDYLGQIAIIGMAGRFPGAPTLDQFWLNLCAGVESVRFFGDEELAASGVPDSLLRDPSYVRAGAVLDGVEMFDAGLFGYSPREAEVTDPQQRVFLECAWEALEEAGYGGGRGGGAVGVYAGVGMNTYLLGLWSRPDVLAAVGGFQALIGNDKDHVATRVSYKLDLRGPSVTVQTACSTSLVAVHLACQSLLSGECDMALAGGVRVSVPQVSGYQWKEGGIASPDGHCRAFDARAAGTLSGSGAGVVVLKRLGEAVADRDHIEAVIRATAINNDGALKVGYTAPSVSGQAEVISECLSLARVNPETISYVEAHGTGTPLGDPIEVEALTQAFRASTSRSGFCALGSVKTNVGHLDTAAGVAGLIKTVLALRHRRLPPTLHFTAPNPRIDFASSPFYVNAELREWEAGGGGVRRAGVSSFGIGGTNAHVIVEEWAGNEDGGEVGGEVGKEVSKEGCGGWQVLPLSARGEWGLNEAAGRLGRRLEQLGASAEEVGGSDEGSLLADVAFTLQVGRRAMTERMAVLCRDLDGARRALAGEAAGGARAWRGRWAGGRRGVALLFGGQGGQYVNMGRGLYEAGGAYREGLDEWAEALRCEAGWDVREWLYPEAGGEEEAEGRLVRTEVSQGAVVGVGLGLWRMWERYGVRGEAVCGHSVGEYAAGVAAGVMSVRECARVVAERGRLMQGMEAGSMLAVGLSEREVLTLLEEYGELSLSAVNAPSLCVVAGPTPAVERLEQSLVARDVYARRLHTSHAFHSSMMEPAVERFVEVMRGVDLRPPRVPLLSNVTGRWLTAEEATDPAYWGRHLRQTVRFSEAASELSKGGRRVLLEVGPGDTLSTIALQQLGDRKGDVPVIATLSRKGQADEGQGVAQAVARLFVAGVEPEWEALHRGVRRRLSLPTYPFERQRYWLDRRPGEAEAATGADRLSKRQDISDWFYVPLWKQTTSPLLGKEQKVDGGREEVLMFDSGGPLDHLIAARLIDAGCRLTRLRPALSFSASSDDIITLDPSSPSDYDRLFEHLLARGRRPSLVLHLWGLRARAGAGVSAADGFAAAQEMGFYSLLWLAQGYGRHALGTGGGRGEGTSGGRGSGLRVVAVSEGAQEVTGGERLRPERATAAGACLVVGREYPGVTCRSVDLESGWWGVPDWGAPDGVGAGQAAVERNGEGVMSEQARRAAEEVSRAAEEVSRQVAAEALWGGEASAAWRGRHRWVEVFERVRLGGGRGMWRLREGGVYLITGGMGGVGRAVGLYLAGQVGAKVVAVGRREEREYGEEWERWKEEVAGAGGEAMGVRADVSREEEMREAVREAEERFGPINGVVHAAGITGAKALRPIQELTPALCEEQFRAKAQGLYALEKVFEDRELDFCVLFSSLSAVLGGLGFAAYAAANSFMDAFVRWHNRTSRVPWISVNWDGWNLSGERKPSKGLGATLADLAILPQEGVEAFARLLSQRELQRVIVSTGDLHARIEQWVTQKGPEADEPEKTAEAVAYHPRPDLPNPFVAPRDETEQKIAEILQSLLGIESIGVEDNFFDLGGHSLLATQVVSRLRLAFSLDLPLRTLFESPTVSSLASALARLSRSAAPPPPPPLAPAPRRGPLPLSFAQQRLWFIDQLRPGTAAYNIPGALHLRGPLDVEALGRTVAEVVRRHEALRTRFRLEGGEPVQEVCEWAAGALEVEEVGDAGGAGGAGVEAEVRRLAEEEARRPFDLSEGPLLRVRVLRLGEEEHVALWTMHHIVSDAWSMGVLTREVAALYGAYSRGQESPLSELPIQYGDYAVWQREWLQGEVLEEQLSYWRQQLSGAPEALSLPTDYPRPAALSHRGATVSFTLDAELSESLRTLSRSEGVTLFMTLLAAFKTLLCRYTGQEDVVVGTGIANRNQAETEALIGFFVNMLALRTDLSGNPSFRELIGRVREVTLGAYARQDIPFEKLVEELQPERDLSRTPFFQTVFVLQNTPPPVLEMPGLELRPLKTESGMTHFDLTMYMEDNGRELIGSLEYATDLFEPETVRRLLRHFEALLGEVAASPDRRLLDIPLPAAGPVTDPGPSAGLPDAFANDQFVF